jgi:hypothetical protein
VIVIKSGFVKGGRLISCGFRLGFVNWLFFFSEKFLSRGREGETIGFDDGGLARVLSVQAMLYSV